MVAAPRDQDEVKEREKTLQMTEGNFSVTSSSLLEWRKTRQKRPFFAISCCPFVGFSNVERRLRSRPSADFNQTRIKRWENYSAKMHFF